MTGQTGGGSGIGGDIAVFRVLRQGECGEGDHLAGGIEHGRVGGMFFHGNNLALIHTPVGSGKLIHPVRAEGGNLPADIDIARAIVPGICRGDITLPISTGL